MIEVRLVPERAWIRPGGLAAHLDEVSLRVGGLLLLMGVLHSVTIVVLPVIGLVFSSGWYPGASLLSKLLSPGAGATPSVEETPSQHRRQQWPQAHSGHRRRSSSPGS